jgi:hypothetical protein
MTIIERCSLSPRSHPLMDSASGQSWPAIAMPLTGISADVTDGDLDLDAIGPLARPGILDRDLVKYLIDFASPGRGAAPTVPPQRQTGIRSPSVHVTHSSQWIAMCALFAAPTVSVVVRILLWSLDVGRPGTGR